MFVHFAWLKFGAEKEICSLSELRYWYCESLESENQIVYMQQELKDFHNPVYEGIANITEVVILLFNSLFDCILIITYDKMLKVEKEYIMII